MITFILAFLAGDFYLQSFQNLPSNWLLIILVCINLLLIIWVKKYARYYIICLAFMLGFLWCTLYAKYFLSWSLMKELEGKQVFIRGFIASLPTQDEFGTHFLFRPKHLNHINIHPSILFRLTWRSRERIKVGDEWQFLARLKRIHGVQSIGAFDYEAWSLQKGIRAQGYVVSHQMNQLISHHWNKFIIDQYRQKLFEKLQKLLPHSHTSPWLITLILGEHSGIAKEDWQILRMTGTNHLMAIAGLHIGIIATFTHAIVNYVWRYFPFLVLRLPAMQAGACASLLVALFYSVLAGFSIPTQRACIMLFIFNITMLMRRKINAWYAWSLAMLFALMINPLSVLTQSFWLSFGTIALILYGMSGRLSPRGWWWRWGRVQWVIGLGLIPLSLILYQQCSFISVIANSIAIPFLSILILPFCLLSAICLFISPSLTHLFLYIADKSLAVLWLFLTWMSKLPNATWQHAIPNFQILVMMIFGILLLLLPKGMPGRWLGIIWVLPCLLYKSEKPAIGEVWLTLLDVGQGLSAIIQTQNHVLVYDTGAKYNERLDMGESVVSPYLHYMNIKYIDKLIISHGDNDHIGGAQTLLNTFPVYSIYSSVPEKILTPVTHFCLAGMTWQWDAVKFSFIYPNKETLELNNNSSCVLRIDNGKDVILLTGDIEKFAEKELLRNSVDQLHARILIAPHHGSKTSGVAKFITTVHPQYVLYSTGYRNRYHFPHPSITFAYTKMNAIQFNTADTGTLQLKIEKGKKILPVESYRFMHKRYWMDEKHE